MSTPGHAPTVARTTADDQADGQNRLVKNILGTDKEITELKEQLQTCTDERDKLQSSLEHLTRDHDAAKARNEELTNKLAELQQNQPDAGLPKRLEEVEKSHAEMENELIKWRTGQKVWQEELRKKDVDIQRLRSDLDNEKRMYKYTKDLHDETVGDFTHDLGKMEKRSEEWKSIVLNTLKQKVERLESRNQSLDSELTEANQSISQAQNEVQKLKDEMSEFTTEKQKDDAEAAAQSLGLAALKREAEQQELNIVGLEELCSKLDQDLQQVEEQRSQVQMDLNELREQAHDSRTEAEQAWARLMTVEREHRGLQQLTEELQQLNTALTGRNREQRLAINSLEQDTQHFIRIIGSLTGVQLDTDSWNTVLHLVRTPVHGLDELTPFWRVDQSWGETRSISEYRPSENSSEMLTTCFNLFATLVTSSDEVDWRNRAVQVTQCLMRELQGADEAQIYVAFLEEFASLVSRLVDQGKLQKNDPLVFSIRELLACANEMSTGMLWEPTNLLQQRLGGRWKALSRAMRAGYTHLTEEAISNLFDESVHFRAPGIGVLLDKDRLTGVRWYIVLDFNAKARAIRVMEGGIWSFVAGEGGFGAVCFRGSDDLTVTIPLAGLEDVEWWSNSEDTTIEMEVD